MATILCLSSQVVRGAVGASAARAALERLGHRVWVLPTVVLSSHLGHVRVAGPTLAADDLKAMLNALEANGWLGEAHAVLTGYMPSAAHAAVAFDAIGRVRAARPDALALCDPACGDAPGGLYVAQEAAEAIHDWLIPAADIARLNLFELAWATGRTVMDERGALAAARALGPANVLVTSAPGDDAAHVCNLLVEGDRAWSASAPRRARAPHGTGDFLSGLFLGHVLHGRAPDQALALAAAALECALDMSEGADELELFGEGAGWADAPPRPVERVAPDQP